MRRTISYILLTLIFIQSFGTQNFILNFMHDFNFEYRLHTQKFNDNIFQFISKHYGSLRQAHAAERKKEQQKHQNKHKHCFFHIHVDQYFLNSGLAFTFHPVDFSKQIFYYRENFTSPYFRSVIDPPDFS